MDNLTHSLTGLAMARAGLDRYTPHASLLLLLSANIPDADILALTQGQLQYLQAHRGLTHCFIALPVLAAVCVLLVAAVYRTKLPWLSAWLVCYLGTASHLLLDWTNSYGIRPFLPFSYAWFHLDLNGLYDAVIMIMLLLALLWPLFSRLVGSEIGDRRQHAGRGAAVAALVFFLLFDVFRGALHNRAIAQLESRLYNGATPLAVSALPEAFNPFRWQGVVETAEAYRSFTVNVLGQLDTDAGSVYYKPAATVFIANATRTQAFHSFLNFARFPVWSVLPVATDPAGGKRIDLTDLRFGRPGAGGFHSIALENGAGTVLQSWFTFGSGSDLGWPGK